MKVGNNIQVNDIVQINPEHSGRKAFAGCLLIVCEVKSFGVQGYISVPTKLDEPAQHAYYRVNFEDIVKVGSAEWVVE